MDLRSEYPRSVRTKLGEYIHLARMIDKCRAKHAGTLGEYIYPCPMDQYLLDFAGITSDDFLKAVAGKTDDEILTWFESTARLYSHQDIENWNTRLLNRGPDTDEKRIYFKKILDSIDSSRTDVITWADLLDLEEQRLVPARP